MGLKVLSGSIANITYYVNSYLHFLYIIYINWLTNTIFCVCIFVTYVFLATFFAKNNAIY